MDEKGNSKAINIYFFFFFKCCFKLLKHYFDKNSTNCNNVLKTIIAGDEQHTALHSAISERECVMMKCKKI